MPPRREDESTNCPDTKALNPYTGNCVSKSTAKSFTGLCKIGKEAINVITSKCVDVHEYSEHVKVLSKMLNVKRTGAEAIKDATKGVHNKPRRTLSLGRPVMGSSVAYHEVKLREYQPMFEAFNCHMGQLKLFYTLFEFLLEVETAGIDLSKCLIVYIGSAPGTNIKTVSEFFPNATFLLYDPAKFDPELKDNPNVHIRTDKAGMFTIAESCDEILEVKKELGKKQILFVSDIRMDPNEEDVKKDMLLQQDAVFELDPLAYMLKFRLPYVDPDGKIIDNSYDLHPAYKNLVRTSTRPSSVALNKKHKSKNAPTFRYLGGSIYLQLYGPVRSTETRLIGFRTLNGVVTPKGKYEMRIFDCLKYENLMNAFNLSWRAVREYDLKLIKPFMEEPLWKDWAPSYETVSELLMWDRYLIKKKRGYKRSGVGKRSLAIRDSISRMHELMGITLKKRETCKTVTSEKHAAKHAQSKKKLAKRPSS